MVINAFFLLDIPAGHLRGAGGFHQLRERADQSGNGLAILSETAGADARKG